MRIQGLHRLYKLLKKISQVKGWVLASIFSANKAQTHILVEKFQIQSFFVKEANAKLITQFKTCNMW